MCCSIIIQAKAFHMAVNSNSLGFGRALYFFDFHSFVEALTTADIKVQ